MSNDLTLTKRAVALLGELTDLVDEISREGSQAQSALVRNTLDALTCLLRDPDDD